MKEEKTIQEELKLQPDGRRLGEMSEADLDVLRELEDRDEDEERSMMKPPTGLMPKWLLEEKRKSAIRQAVNRYFMAGGYQIPIEWIEEYNQIVARNPVRPGIQC